MAYEKGLQPSENDYKGGPVRAPGGSNQGREDKYFPSTIRINIPPPVAMVPVPPTQETLLLVPLAAIFLLLEKLNQIKTS